MASSTWARSPYCHANVFVQGTLTSTFDKEPCESSQYGDDSEADNHKYSGNGALIGENRNNDESYDIRIPP
jgi:hypothetical protein